MACGESTFHLFCALEEETQPNLNVTGSSSTCSELVKQLQRSNDVHLHFCIATADFEVTEDDCGTVFDHQKMYFYVNALLEHWSQLSHPKACRNLHMCMLTLVLIYYGTCAVCISTLPWQLLLLSVHLCPTWLS